jgi:hypothetical protein
MVRCPLDCIVGRKKDPPVGGLELREGGMTLASGVAGRYLALVRV